MRYKFFFTGILVSFYLFYIKISYFNITVSPKDKDNLRKNVELYS